MLVPLKMLKVNDLSSITVKANEQVYITVRCPMHGKRTLVTGETLQIDDKSFCQHCQISVELDHEKPV